MSNADVVRHFGRSSRTRTTFAIVDELMAEDFEHHLPYPGVPPGRDGMLLVSLFGITREAQQCIPATPSTDDDASRGPEQT